MECKMSLPTGKKVSIYLEYRCRICLKAKSGGITLNNTINCEDGEIPLNKLLEFCVNEQVCENGKADRLCLACVRKGIICYKFKKKFQESQSILLKEIEEDKRLAMKIEGDLNEEDLVEITVNEVLTEEKGILMEKLLDDNVSMDATEYEVVKEEILYDDVSQDATEYEVVKEEILDDDISVVATENGILKEQILDDDVSVVATEYGVLKEEILDDDVSVDATVYEVVKEEILDDDVSVVATEYGVLKEEILDDDVSVDATEEILDNDVSVVATKNGVLKEAISDNEIRQIAENTVSNLGHNKSRPQYDKQYGKFCEWCNVNNITVVSENVLLKYFELQSEKYKPTTLCLTYSMLKSSLSKYKDVDISEYIKLQALMKRIYQDYAPERSRILEEEDIHKFIRNADDKFYLAMKVALIMSYHGALSRKELRDIFLDDIEYRSDSIVVSVCKKYRNISRMFTITDTHWIYLIKKYANLRPTNVKHKRFFLSYRNGRCINTIIGFNFMWKISKYIAKFLKLPNADLYTGYCFRRSGATNFAKHGGELLTIKKVGVNLPGCSSSASNDSSRNSSSIYNVPGLSITAHETSNDNINVFNNCTIKEQIFS